MRSPEECGQPGDVAGGGGLERVESGAAAPEEAEDGRHTVVAGQERGRPGRRRPGPGRGRDRRPGARPPAEVARPDRLEERGREPPDTTGRSDADGHAAVDEEDLARDEGRVLGGEEGVDSGDLLGPGDPAGRNLGDDLLADRLGNAREHARHDGPGRDAVHGDPELGVLEREGAGEADDARLRGRVVGLADVPERADRRRVDDAPPAMLSHPRQRGLGAEERALEVDREDLVPLLLGHLVAHRVAVDPGVVDEHVQPAELRRRRG